MNVTLEVASWEILIIALSGFNQDPKFNQAIQMATEKQKTSQEDFIDLFYQSFRKLLQGNVLLLFSHQPNSER
jgi:SecD/SecF fusion protein